MARKGKRKKGYGRVDAKVVSNFSDRDWRLRNLYWIINERGERVKFVPNEGQERFLGEMHSLNVILKARQLGFSTLIQLLLLDACVFNSNVNAGVIAQSLNDAEEIFRTKIKFPYENLPEGIRELVKPVSDSKKALELSNNSQIRVGTSLRGATLTWLHISEHAKICQDSPERAREIRTGALNTVHVGQAIFVESTARGKEGDFFKLCKRARDLQESGKDLTDLDFKFHFHPWWRDPKYRLDPYGVVIDSEIDNYFGELELKHGVELDDWQKAWYAKKFEIQQQEMKQEYPSTPEEAFEVSLEGAYFAVQMGKARSEKRLGRLAYDPTRPVHTAWDLGMGDHTCVWFYQRDGHEIRFIDYYENSGEEFAHYVRHLQSKAYVYGRHYIPHDAKKRDLRAKGTLLDDAIDLLPGEVYLVPRVADKQNAIEMARGVLPFCWFDEGNCKRGIACLDNYRKEWNEHLGIYRKTPRHDWASHGADAFMTFVTGDTEGDTERFSATEAATEMESDAEYEWYECDATTGY